MERDMAEEYMALNAALVEPLLDELSGSRDDDDDFMNSFIKMREASVSKADGCCLALEAKLATVGDMTRKLKEKRQSAELRLSSRLGTVETMSEIVAETERLARRLDCDRKELGEAKQRLVAVDADVERTTRMAKDVVEKSNRFKNLLARKHFLFRVTRINWETPKASDADHVRRGFVINPLKRDVITFKVDKRDHNENYLWNCIGTGCDPVWKGPR